MSMSTIQKVDIGCALVIAFACALSIANSRRASGGGRLPSGAVTEVNLTAAELQAQKTRRRAM